jgi:hypothetical protein
MIDIDIEYWDWVFFEQKIYGINELDEVIEIQYHHFIKKLFEYDLTDFVLKLKTESDSKGNISTHSQIALDLFQEMYNVRVYFDIESNIKYKTNNYTGSFFCFLTLVAAITYYEKYIEKHKIGLGIDLTKVYSFAKLRMDTIFFKSRVTMIEIFKNNIVQIATPNEVLFNYHIKDISNSNGFVKISIKNLTNIRKGEILIKGYEYAEITLPGNIKFSLKN